MKTPILIGIAVCLASCSGPAKPFVPSVRSLVYAAESGNIGRVTRYVNGGVEINSARHSGKTPLAAASGRSHKAVVEYLLSKGANPDGVVGQRSTPIYQASAAGADEIVGLLLAAKANPNVVDQTTGETPLTIAARRGHIPVIERLLAGGAQIALPTRLGKTPLATAAAANRGTAASVLIKAGADLRGMTWVELLSATGHAKTFYAEFKNLLPLGRQPTEADLQRITNQLHRSVAARFQKAYMNPLVPLNAMIKAGLDINARDKDGRTALEVAWRLHLPETMMLLLFNRATGARQQISAITAEMAQTRTSQQKFLEAVKRDPWIGTFMRTGPKGLVLLTTRKEMLNMTMFFATSRSLHAGMLAQFLKVDKDFPRRR